MKGKEVVILNEANILEARDILSEKRGYIDENGNIWTYRDLCDAIYNSSVGYEDFYGEWIEVEERYFYEVQERKVRFRTPAQRQDPGSCIRNRRSVHLCICTGRC